MAISGHSRDIKLRSGGVLYVGLDNCTLGDFGEDERALMSRIADAMHNYERSRGSQAADAVAGTVDQPQAVPSREEQP